MSIKIEIFVIKNRKVAPSAITPTFLVHAKSVFWFTRGGASWNRSIGECRVGVAGRKDTGGEVTDGAGAQPLGCAGGLDITQDGYN